MLKRLSTAEVQADAIMDAEVLSWQRVKALPAQVWLLLWGNFFVRGSYFMVWPFLAVMLYQRFGLSASETGFWLTVAAVCAAFVGFYAGHLSDRFGRKPVMLLGALLGGVAFSALALADSLPWIIASIFLASLPRALWDAPAKAWLGDVLTDSKDRELALQAMYFMVNAGATTGPVLGLWLGFSGNPLGFFITAASYSALGIGLWYLYQAPSSSTRAVQGGLHFRNLLQLLVQDRMFAMIIIANILINFIYAHADASLIQYLTRASVPDLVVLISTLVTTNSLMIVTCQFPLLKLLQGWPVERRIQLGVVLMALSQLWFALNPVQFFAGWIGAMVVLSLGEAILFANMNVHLDRLAHPQLRGSYFGAASLYALGFSVSPWLGGLVIDRWGGSVLFMISALLCALVLGCYAISPHLSRPDFRTLLAKQTAS